MAKEKIKDRRRGPDPLVKGINYMVIVSWLIILIVFMIVAIAKPQTESFLDRYNNVSLRATWDKTLIEYAFYMMFPLFLACIVGLLINSSRMQRRTDRYKKSLIFFLFLSMGGIIYYFLR